MKLFLGIDLGTSYFKVGVFDEQGQTRGLGRLGVEPVAPAPGHAELPVDQFWRLLRTGVGTALKMAAATPSDIAGVSYSSQANTFVLLGKGDEPLTPFILWTDKRVAALDPDLVEFSCSVQFGEATGFNGMTNQWAAAKWRWLQQQRPAVWRSMRRIMTMSDYFTHALTGERVGDAGTAALLGVYELARGTWWPEGLRRLEIEPAQLSRPLRPGAPAGHTNKGTMALLGLPAGIPIAVGGLDHQVAALGSGLGSIADVSISTGTVLAAMALVRNPAVQSGCYHGPHFSEDRFYRLAFDPNGAGRLEKLQKRLFPGVSIGTMIEDAIQEVAPLGAPGAGQQVARQEILNILTSVARAQWHLIGQVAHTDLVHRIVATGGGARSAAWLQMKADFFGIPIVTPTSAERACLGAAILAGVAAGAFADIASATTAMVRTSDEIQPRTLGILPKNR